MTFPIQIDAKALSAPSFSIQGVTGTLPTTSLQTVQLEAGSYRLLTHAEADTTWQFDITPAGLVDYQPLLDVSQGGFLTGRGSNILTLVGLPIAIDGQGLTTQRYSFYGITEWLASNQSHTLQPTFRS